MGLMDVTRDDAHTQLAVIVGYNFFMAVARSESCVRPMELAKTFSPCACLCVSFVSLSHRTRYLPLRMYGNESRDLLYRARYCVEMAHKLSSKLIFVQACHEAWPCLLTAVPCCRVASSIWRGALIAPLLASVVFASADFVAVAVCGEQAP